MGSATGQPPPAMIAPARALPACEDNCCSLTLLRWRIAMRGNCLRAVLATMVAGCWGCGSVDDTTTPEPTPLAAERTPAGTVRGRVLTTAREPIAWARVRWLPWPPSGDPGAAIVGPALSGGAGAFVLAGVPAGRPGIVEARVASSPPGYSGIVAVAPGATVEGVEIVIASASRATGSIAGRVVDTRGQPLAGISVALLRDGTAVPDDVATTNASGRYHMDGVAEGDRIVGVFVEVCRCRETARVRVLPGHVNVAPDIVLRGSVIAGTVVDEAGPVSRFRVAMHQTSGPDGSPANGATTYRPVRHEDGVFLVELRAGTWNLIVATPDGRLGVLRGLTVTCGEPLAGLEVHVEDVPRVSGQVVDKNDGTPIRDVRIILTFGSAGTGPYSDGDYGGATTDRDGRFTVSTVPEEPFRLVVSHSDYKTRVVSQPPAPGAELRIEMCRVSRSDCVTN
jgi:hypothetical protein